MTTALKTLRHSLAGPSARAFALLAITTAVALPLRETLRTTDIAMLYLVPVVIAAARLTRRAGILASVLAVALFDFLFVPPFYTFAVAEPTFFITFAVMLGVALVITGLTATIREQREEAVAREAQATALYRMSQEAAQASSLEVLLEVIARHVGAAVGGKGTVLLDADAGLGQESPAWPAGGVFDNMLVRLASSWAFVYGKPAGRGTPRNFDADALVLPIPGREGPLGVVALVPEEPDASVTDRQLHLAESLAALGGVELLRALPLRGRAAGYPKGVLRPV